MPTNRSAIATTADARLRGRALPAVVVHIALRREFRLAGPLVRDIPSGDTVRAETVARHLELLFRFLHHHHELEDELVWPPLRARAGTNLVPIVDRMEDQHVEISRFVRHGEQLAGSLRATAARDTRDRLADLLDELHVRLVEHLDLEEQVVLPLAEQHLDAEEWDEIGRRADAGIPRNERALSFGMLQYEGDPHVLASMLAEGNRLVRTIVPLLARRAYRRHATAVHGTPTP